MSTTNPASLLSHSPITHGWIKPVLHPDLGVTVNGQSTVRYLRFGRDVRVDRLELKPVLSGRWVPSVPTHPAHVTVSALDVQSGCWRLIADVELPPDPRTRGDSLNQHMSISEMESVLLESLGTSHAIELGGVTTDVLRVECDREHPVWPNHGEVNGTPFNVPFGVLDDLTAFGEAPAGEMDMPAYLPPLTIASVNPIAPENMEIEVLPWLVMYRSPSLSIGFSLVRPEILHLGWDGVGGNRAAENRLFYRAGNFSGWSNSFSGPTLRTASADLAAPTWSGNVDVTGNHVRYSGLHCDQGSTIDATFTISSTGFHLDLTQQADHAVRVLEASAWRFAWNCGAAMTSAAAVPTLRPGRNGDVNLPMFWAGDGNGCLRCEKLSGDAYVQIESYRSQNAVVGDLALGDRPAADECQLIPAGTRSASWEFSVASFEPVVPSSSASLVHRAIRRHWGSVYSCFRPELGGFSNHAISCNCHVNQHAPMELAAFTRAPERGPDPLELYRFTIERALLAGGGYGFYRNLYLDSDPILVSGAGRIHQARPNIDWLTRIEPGLVAAVNRMLETIGPENMAICRDLSGNSGTYRWSSNAFDVVGFGHMDGYVNAWTYRGLMNAAPLLGALDQPDLSEQCASAAEALRIAYRKYLLNPDTGWVAGWRSRDGRCHDAGFLWVNGVACAFGLLPHATAAESLRRLEDVRREVGAGRSHFGLPFNLAPIPATDHMLPIMNGRFSPTFETYTDGSMGPHWAVYYIRSLDIHGLTKEAEQIVMDMEVGYDRGHFNGPNGSGVEFYRWDGAPTGYEGTFVGNWEALYGMSVHRGLFEPTTPEWWPSTSI